MNRTFFTPIKSAVIFSLVLVLALSVAWGGKNRVRKKTVYKGGDTTHINIDRDPKGGRIRATIIGCSADDYMTEQAISEVQITVETIEEWVDDGGGNSHRRFTFIFGPSGTYFNLPLELTLKGEFVTDDVWLYGEDGEAIEYQWQGGDNFITFFINHFSSYSYDLYNY